jgi:uncharacterized protein with HEPN domain
MNNRDYETIHEIRRHCEIIADAKYVYGDNWDSFQKNVHYQQSVAFSLLQVCETSIRLSDEFKSQTQHLVEWGKIRRMRTWFAHIYDRARLDLIWKATAEHVPQLTMFCNRVLRQHEQENDISLKP